MFSRDFEIFNTCMILQSSGSGGASSQLIDNDNERWDVAKNSKQNPFSYKS